MDTSTGIGDVPKSPISSPFGTSSSSGRSASGLDIKRKQLYAKANSEIARGECEIAESYGFEMPRAITLDEEVGCHENGLQINCLEKHLEQLNAELEELTSGMKTIKRFVSARQ